MAREVWEVGPGRYVKEYPGSDERRYPSSYQPPERPRRRVVSEPFKLDARLFQLDATIAAVEAEISETDGPCIDLRLLLEHLGLERAALVKRRASAVRSRLAEVVAEAQMPPIERTTPAPRPPIPPPAPPPARKPAVARPMRYVVSFVGDIAERLKRKAS